MGDQARNPGVLIGLHRQQRDNKTNQSIEYLALHESIASLGANSQRPSHDN